MFGTSQWLRLRKAVIPAKAGLSTAAWRVVRFSREVKASKLDSGLTRHASVESRRNDASARGFRIALATTTALAALALAGCAGNERSVRDDANARDCFSASSVRSFSAVDDNTVRLNVGARDTYELALFGYCPDIDWTRSVGLRTFAGGSWICTNDAAGVEVVVLDRTVPVGPDRCRVRSMRKLDPAELEAEKAAREAARTERKAARQ